ncbi:hypothetical protein [Haloechinothrix salitolerans]|uniref:SnoaL-like domain-containing protein n=1 Tax=Haloechinothrix salitolerans TaxID=926830 RepID=A0ABW2C9T4_9PSEU
MRRQRRSGRTQPPERIEDVFSERVLSDPNVDRDYLNALLHDPSPLRVPEPGGPDHSVDAPAEDTVWEEPETTAARVAKLTGLVLAVALLCGALVAAVFLDRYRTAARQAPPERQITGIAALAGFAMTTSPHAETAPVTQRANPVRRSDAATAPTQSATESGNTPSATPEPTLRANTDDDSGAFVRDFYRSVTEEPEDALGMLGGSLLDGQPDALSDALRFIDTVTVHRVSVRPDGLVRAVITVTRADSQRYRVTHLLRVEAGPPALITEARLLSAQHSPRP